MAHRLDESEDEEVDETDESNGGSDRRCICSKAQRVSANRKDEAYKMRNE